MTWAEPPGLVIQLVQTLGRQAEDGSQSASHMIDANRMRADAKKKKKCEIRSSKCENHFPQFRISNFEFRFSLVAAFHYQLDAAPGNESALGVFVFNEELLADVLSDVLKEVLELVLHLIHLFSHVQDDLDAREIDPKIASEVQNEFEPLDVLFGVV